MLLLNNILYVTMAKEPNVDEFVSLISSPKTNKIYKEPIILDNGEIEELDEYIGTDKKNQYHAIVRLKTFINTFLDEYPEYKSKQYICNQLLKTTHKFNQQIINKIINTKNLQNLKQYTQFELSLLTSADIDTICKIANEDTLIYFVDNIIGDIHELFPERNWRLVNYICNKCCSANKNTFVRYFIEKYGGMQYYCEDDHWYPLHQIVHFSKNSDLIKFGIDKHLESNLDLYCENSDGTTILNYIFQKSNSDIINYTLSKIDKTWQEFKDHLNNLCDTLNNNSQLNDNERENIMNKLVASV